MKSFGKYLVVLFVLVLVVSAFPAQPASAGPGNGNNPDGRFVTGGGWFDSPASAAPIPTIVWDQGFETDAMGWIDASSDWYGTVSRVPSGTNGIASSAGSYHAIFEGDASSGPFSRFDGYRDYWPGTWTAAVDIYLDPNWSAGTGFDYSVAASRSDGNHLRDFIFHVTKDISTGKLLVAGSNNTNFAPREDLETINHYEVTEAGWYTFQHVFYEQSGALAVDLNLLDAAGNILFTETRSNPADTIPEEVGGNRYAWFTFIDVDGGIAVDEHQLEIPVGPTGKANFAFNSKSKNGDSLSGQVEFRFNAGDLNFHSSGYDWMEFDPDGSSVQFGGLGSLNGMAGYEFTVSATDGSPDTFGIRIWNADDGTVVYDNGMGQAIRGGSIVVHAR